MMKFSNNEQKCFLCKHAADSSTLKQMEKNFNTEKSRQSSEAKAKDQKRELYEYLEQACESHSADKVLKMIEDKENELIQMKQSTQKFDQKVVQSDLIQLQVLQR